MKVLNQQGKSDLYHYIGLMYQKACLHLRLCQGGHVTSILASLFDIINDQSILGIEEKSCEQNLTYVKPIPLFVFDDEVAI